VQCTTCQAENREGRRFCASCGAALAIACPSCGFANDPDDKFCGGCGTALSAAAEARAEPTPAAPAAVVEAPQADRRQVTILFADLSGYTRLSSQLDPEEIHYILKEYFGVVDQVVDAYGGTIDKHIGDAVMAVFGAPKAHSNDPERAVRAAVEMHAAMAGLSGRIGRELKIHIGIASGRVVASGLGSRSHSAYTVTGDSVNLAARLVAMAKSGETFISDAVHGAVSDLVQVGEVGEVEVKGLERPVKVWRLEGLSEAPKRRSETLFVGRRAEIHQFESVLATYHETETGQTVYVRGEAGIGKSRLVQAFAELAEKEGFACHSSLVLDFGVGRGQDAIRGLLRSLLAQNDMPEAVGSVDLAERILAEGLIDETHLVFLHDLLDLPRSDDMLAVYDAMDNDTRIRGKQDCLTTLVERLSARRPLMLMIEDVHWADALTLAYLAQLSALVSRARILLIMTSRTEGDPLDQAWRQAAGGPSLMTIDLAPLNRKEAMVLARGFVDANRRLALTSIERAEGNPLFLEQLLRSTAADGEEDVPGSVQSIVLSRVDRLSASDKRALQAAAVLGQRFSPEILRYLMGDPDYRFDNLISHHLLRQLGREFLFSHALIWESVYASILREARQKLHERAAEWFANRDPDLYAEHLERAQDPRAPAAYAQASALQARHFHFERAIGLCERGLALATDKADRYQLYMRKGEYLREMGRPGDSIAVYHSALDATDDDIERCQAWIGLAAGMRVTDEFDEALDNLDRAEAVAQANALDLELSQIHYYRGNLYFPLGNIEGCLQEHEKALDFAGRAAAPACEARALSGLGDAHYARGRMITALGYFRRCIALCRQQGFGRIEVGNQYMVAWGRVYINELAGALKEARSAVDAALRAGHQRAEMVALLTVGRILVEQGDLTAAEPQLERGLALADSLGAKRFKPFLMIYLARLRFAQHGPKPETEAMLREAYEISEQTGISFLGPWVLGTLALVSEDRKVSSDALAQGEALLRQDCVGHNYFAFYRAAMEVALRQQDWDEVERYAEALEAYTRPEPLPWTDYFRRPAHRSRGGGDPDGKGTRLHRVRRRAGRPSTCGRISRICSGARRRLWIGSAAIRSVA
jgi:class 3 adenylate cyclase/tetratricopeptide (TPR) repeat protein